MKMSSRFWIIFITIVAAVIYRKFKDFTKPLPPPSINVAQYWGAEDENNYVPDETITLLKINYHSLNMDNLTEILGTSLNLHEPLEDINGMEYGMNTNILKEYIDYWRDEYLPKWMSRVHYLNLLPHYSMEVQGLTIHYVHTKMILDTNARVLPLLLLHGWPGSIREMYDFISHLATPSDDKDAIFEIVVPSLPGFGWSEGPSKPGFGPVEMSIVIRNLMIKLGYDEFYIQGGDWGATIGSNIATLFPENVIGFHSNLCFLPTPLSFLKSAVASFYPTYFIDAEYEDFIFPITDKLMFLVRESGYFHLQVTKPDTIGTILTDNPIGLAAYMLEKFLSYENNITKDAILDNIMIYYITNSMATSVRLYAESYTSKHLSYNMLRVPTSVPTGCARFKHDFGHSLDWQLRDKFTNLVHSTFHKEGGHFAALEQPELLYKDFMKFIRIVEEINSK